MVFNMDWLRAIIDKLYIYLCGLSDYELFEAFFILIIVTVVAWVFLPEIPNISKYLSQNRKTKKASQKLSPAADTAPNTVSETVTLPADSRRTSSCSQKCKTISAPALRASCAKPELDIEELKELLNKYELKKSNRLEVKKI